MKEDKSNVYIWIIKDIDNFFKEDYDVIDKFGKPLRRGIYVSSYVIVENTTCTFGFIDLMVKM